MNPHTRLLATLLLLLLALLQPRATHAQQQLEQSNQTACPWFTAGTAAAILGGPVLSVVKLANSAETPEGSCTFTSSTLPSPSPQDASLSTIEIVVTRTPAPACPSDSPKLTGIGNKATACRLERSATEVRYAIDSRVRDLYLRISLTLRDASTSPTSKSTANQQQLLERVAEQVTGNLY